MSLSVYVWYPVWTCGFPNGCYWFVEMSPLCMWHLKPTRLSYTSRICQNWYITFIKMSVDCKMQLAAALNDRKWIIYSFIGHNNAWSYPMCATTSNYNNNIIVFARLMHTHIHTINVCIVCGMVVNGKLHHGAWW